MSDDCNTLKLRPYKACDAQYVVSWLDDEATFRYWSSDIFDHYPLSAQELNDYYDAEKDNPGVWAMTAYTDDGVVGHIKMRFKDEKNSVLRFGMVVVDHNLRGKGYGHEMLRLAIAYAFDFVHADRITLGVFEQNTAARKCYESCGFRRVQPDVIKTKPLMGEVWTCIDLELCAPGL